MIPEAASLVPAAAEGSLVRPTNSTHTLCIGALAFGSFASLTK
jgi:hypothetical protein